MHVLLCKVHLHTETLACSLLFCRAHPYLFFNEVGGSVTFVGFKLSKTGDLLHPATSAVLKRSIATSALMNDLKRNEVDLNEEWDKW